MLSIVENQLTAQRYRDIREKVDFAFYNENDVEAALKNTLYTVEMRDDDKTIGMARVVGDDKIVFFIKDVVVDPLYQGQKIGRKLMNCVLKYIQENACDNAYVGLMATPGTEKFYEKLGFIKRPNDKFGHGMVLFINNKK